jgi:hypothetical protein
LSYRRSRAPFKNLVKSIGEKKISLLKFEWNQSGITAVNFVYLRKVRDLNSNNEDKVHWLI